MVDEDAFDDDEQEQQLTEVASRLRDGRKHLAMTIYSIQHRRRTPEQVRSVLDRASRAIRRSQLVRTRWNQQFYIQ
jgi:hypothetical protein